MSEQQISVPNDSAAVEEETNGGVSPEKSGFGNRLNLVPNEVVGYRILPDQWNWTVVLVKKHGPESKYAGKEYSESLAFCRDMYSATSWIVRYVAAMEGRKSQEAYEKLTGNVASFQVLEAAFAKAENAALAAVKNLEERLEEKGIDLKRLNKKLEFPESAESAEVAEVQSAE